MGRTAITLLWIVGGLALAVGLALGSLTIAGARLSAPAAPILSLNQASLVAHRSEHSETPRHHLHHRHSPASVAPSVPTAQPTEAPSMVPPSPVQEGDDGGGGADD